VTGWAFQVDPKLTVGYYHPMSIPKIASRMLIITRVTIITAIP